MAGSTVLVLGGGGFYGKYLVDDVLRFTDAQVLLVSRRPMDHPSKRVVTAACDRRNLSRLTQLAEQCEILVNFAGPFQDAPLEPIRAAWAAGAHYIDVAEDRAMGRRVRELDEDVRRARIAAFNGLSVVPGMEALFANMLAPCFDRLTSFRGFAAPDTKRHRGKAMFWTMMYGVGREFVLPSGGRPRRARGWSEGEWVRFPPPLGDRLVYLVLEMADADLLPELFGVDTVEFKAGSEWPILNRLLALASSIRAGLGGRPAW
ncbi:MAG: saccharopine dehydrogenase NADP-binding domain-containing protein, partial [Actinomycetota bacterium]|nr:saccharopine dehydrogenase NADP-binding domain-containing protein [Actinomycetota bacterium]